MPRRRNILTTEYYYHIFNRGVAQMPIFKNQNDYQRALITVGYYRFQKPPMKLSHYFQLPEPQKIQVQKDLSNNHSKLIEIVAWVFMENHWHFLVKQTTDNGITSFMSKLSDSYTKYVNTKYKRVGHLFQGPFKSVLIPHEDILAHISRYIHLNPLIGNLVERNRLRSYPWSSLNDYMDDKSILCETKTVLSQFKSKTDYLSFILDQENYARKIKNFQHFLVD